ncbi:MAG: hypothetical protein ACREN8_00185 [Candidatus Dormibacteraceae bacterium]
MADLELQQPILYAEEMWRRWRFLVISLLIFGVVVGGFQLWQSHGILEFNSLSLFAYIPAAALLAVFFLLCRQRSYVKVTERGFRVSGLLGGILIDYDQIRSVKVQPLAQHFQSAGRRRYLRPEARRLLPRAAIYVRLQDEAVERLRVQRKLGRMVVEGDVLAIPIPHPELISAALISHLPERGNQNLGGQRRGRRQR